MKFSKYPKTDFSMRNLNAVIYLRVAFALFSTVSMSVHAETDRTIQYRMAEYAFEVSAPDAGLNANGFKVDWEYPVILGGKPNQTRVLNSWLRQQSLKVLVGCSATLTSSLKKTDRQIIESLSSNHDFVECGIDQSVVVPLAAFGRYISFEMFTEVIGAFRPQHGIEILTFNMESGNPIAIEFLFKPDALGELNSALSEQLRKTKLNCSDRKFDWSQVSVRPPNQLFIHYPYDPAEWAQCGDGVEMLEGHVVSRQLLKRNTLQPLRRLVKVK